MYIFVAGMHRKSIEAAQHLKESGSEREGSEPEPDRAASASPRHHDNHDNQVTTTHIHSSPSYCLNLSPEDGSPFYYWRDIPYMTTREHPARLTLYITAVKLLTIY